MSEKIDLGKLERELHACKGAYFETEDVAEVLALVRAVRAAMKFSNSGHVADRLALQAALEPITDSSDSAEDK